MEPKKLFVTVKQFTKLYPWPTESGLWNLRANRKENGFEKAFKNVGRRVLIDVNVFWDIIGKKEEEKR